LKEVENEGDKTVRGKIADSEYGIKLDESNTEVVMYNTTVMPKDETRIDLADKACLNVDDGVSVCVIYGKGIAQIDIIVVYKDKVKSVRSVTELVNTLMHECEIPHEKIINDVIPWVHVRLARLHRGVI